MNKYLGGRGEIGVFRKGFPRTERQFLHMGFVGVQCYHVHVSNVVNKSKSIIVLLENVYNHNIWPSRIVFLC